MRRGTSTIAKPSPRESNADGAFALDSSSGFGYEHTVSRSVDELRGGLGGFEDLCGL